MPPRPPDRARPPPPRPRLMGAAPVATSTGPDRETVSADGWHGVTPRCDFYPVLRRSTSLHRVELYSSLPRLSNPYIYSMSPVLPSARTTALQIGRGGGFETCIRRYLCLKFHAGGRPRATGHLGRGFCCWEFSGDHDGTECAKKEDRMRATRL